MTHQMQKTPVADQSLGSLSTKTINPMVTPEQPLCNTLSGVDLKQAEEFLSIVFHCGAKQRAGFGTYDDQKERADKSLAERLYGTFAEVSAKLIELNEAGASVCFVPATLLNGKSFTKTNIIGSSLVRADFDKGLPDYFPVQPTTITETSPGKANVFWKLTHDIPAEQIEAINKAVARYFGSDELVCDVGHLMRLPGFVHQKDPLNPFLSRLTHAEPDNIYDPHEFAELFGVDLDSIEAKETRASAKVGSVSKQTESRCDVSVKPKYASLWDELYAMAYTAVMGENLTITVRNMAVKASAQLDNIDEGEIIARIFGILEKCQPGFNEKLALSQIEAGLKYGRKTYDPDKKAKYTEFPLTGAIDVGDSFFPDLKPYLNRVTGLKGNTGTGKSTAIVGLVPGFSKVLALCHNIATERGYNNDIDGCVSYSDPNLSEIGGIRAQARLSIVLNSIVRLRDINGKVPVFSLVILDEIRDFLDYLNTSALLAKDRRIILETLIAILRRAERVVIASAELSDLEIDFICQCMDIPRAEVTVLHCHKKQPAFTFLRANSSEQVIDELLKQLAEGRACFLSVDSRATGEAIESMVKALMPELPVVLYSSRNPVPQGNINEITSKYQLVIATPSINSGVNICESHFDSTFHIYTNGKDIPVQAILQATNRVRYPKSQCRYVFVGKAGSAYTKDRSQIQAENNLITMTRAQFQTIDFYDPEQQVHIVNPFVYNLHTDARTEYMFREGLSKSHRDEKYWSAIEQQGHTIKDMGELEDTEADKLKKDMKEHKELTKLEEATKVAETPLITKEEKEAIDNKVTRTEEERLKLSKYFITKDLRKEPTPEEVLEYNGGKLRSQIKVQEILAKTKEECIKEDSEHIHAFPGDQTYKGESRALLLTAIAMLKPLIEEGYYTEDTLWTYGIPQWTRLKHKEVKRLLGISLPLKKPTLAVKSLLIHLGYEVKGDRTKAKGKWVYRFGVSQTEEMKALITRIENEMREKRGEPSATEESPYDDKGNLNPGWFLNDQGKPQQAF